MRWHHSYEFGEVAALQQRLRALADERGVAEVPIHEPKATVVAIIKPFSEKVREHIDRRRRVRAGSGDE